MKIANAKMIAVAMGGWLCLTSGLLMTACSPEEPSYADRETFEKETYVTLDNTGMSLLDGLQTESFPEDTPEGEWLAGCSAPDRNDQFDAYVLRHESAAEGHTTFTYLIYYPHGGSPLQVTPELMEGESGYVIHLSYADGAGNSGYSLCLLSVTLPTDQAPRMSLLVDGDSLGYISTVTATPIAEGE